MRMNKSKKDNDLYYYFNSKGEKLWSYRYRYYDALGKRREKSKQGFKKENDAYRSLLEIKANVVNGDIKQVESTNLTVSEWMDTWFETHKNDWKERTRIQRECAIRIHIKPLIGKYKLSQLDKTTYKRVFINELLKKYKPGSVLFFHRTFKTAINAAVDDELLPKNRFTNISIPILQEEENFFSPEELKLFLLKAKSLDVITDYTVVLLLAFSGLRRGEALGLKWENINFEDKTLTIERTRDNLGERPPKTENSYRTILIDGTLISQLKLYRNWCKQTKLSFGKHLEKNDFIFISHQDGKPITEKTVNDIVENIIKDTDLKRITPHGLRHTHATILISQRVPIKVIADRLGNTPQMVLDTYAHTLKDLEKESVVAFEQALNL